MGPITQGFPFVETLSFFGTVKKEAGEDEQKPYQRPKSMLRVDDEHDAGTPQPAQKNSKRQITKADGTVVAGPRPIKRDYDSDDSRLIQLKQMGHSDTYVAAQLAKEGRVKYNARTISGRWQRIRKVLEEKEEEQLDDELTDWHEGEDEKLEDVVTQIERKIEEEKARLDARKWRDVAQHFANVTLKRKYSAAACEERWSALCSGTADLPIESDPDKEGRALKRERHQLERQARKALAAAEAQEFEDNKQRAKELIEESKNVKKEEMEMLRAEKEAKRVEERKLRSKIKHAGVDAKKRLIANRKAWLDYMRAESAWEKAKAKAAARIRKHGVKARIRRKKTAVNGEVDAGTAGLSAEITAATDGNGGEDGTTAVSDAVARGEKRAHPDLADDETGPGKRAKVTA